MIFAFFILGLFFPWFLGYVILSFEKNFEAVRYFLAFPLGIGILTNQLFLYSIIGLGFNIIFIFLPWLIVLPYVIYKNKVEFKNPIKISIKFFSKINVVLLIIIIFYLVFIFSETLLYKYPSYDALLIWSFKAKAFFIDGKVDQKFFDYTRKYSQFDYPLLVPLGQAWMSISYGKWSNTLIKLLSPLFYISLLGSFFCMIRMLASPKWALIGTAVLSSFPILVKYSQQPIADIPMVFYLFISVAFVYLIFVKNYRIHFIWPAVFLFFLGWTKNEGLLLSLLLIVLAGISIVQKKKYKDLLKLFAVCGFLAFMNFPWFIFKNELNVHNSIVNLNMISQLDLGHIYFYTPIIVKHFVYKTLLTLSWHGIWLIYLLMIFIYRKRIFNNSKELILNFINISIVIYASVYLLVKDNINLLLSSTSDRLVMHLVPIVLFFIIIVFEEKSNLEEGQCI